jgi:hypothetical protein
MIRETSAMAVQQNLSELLDKVQSSMSNLLLPKLESQLLHWLI